MTFFVGQNVQWRLNAVSFQPFPDYVVAEGIETALSLRCGLLTACGSVWAALPTSGMTGLNLPPIPGELVVSCDGEAAGRSAAHSLAKRATALGSNVSIVDPGDGLDFNDLLQREVAA